MKGIYRRAKARADAAKRMKLHCQANPSAKKCKPKDKSGSKVVTTRGDGGPTKGGGTRKKLGAGGELIPYGTTENDGQSKPKRVARY